VAKSISLEDLVALNDEIAGLVRAGVPLDLGLSGWGRDVPGELGRTASRLGESIAAGQSLSESLADQGGRIPPVYLAIVSAGLRSGRLPAALESLTMTARNLAETRGAIGLAVLYPLILVLLAYGLFIVLATTTISSMMRLYEAPPPRLWSMISGLGDRAASWVGLIPPLALIVVFAFWWYQTRRAIVLDTGSGARWLRVVPVAGRIAVQARAAALAEILGLLVEHEVPLHESIVLAAGCTADRKLIQSAGELAEHLKQGGTYEPDAQPLKAFPPLVAWLISAGGRERAFTALARHVAQTYRRSILRDLDWLRLFLPIWLVVLVGGVVVGVYATTFFLPYSQLLEAFSGHVSQQTLRIQP
jgi:type II secretory pathway component PulF